MIRGCLVLVGLLVVWVIGFLVVVPLLGEAIYDQSPLKGTGQALNRDAYGALALAVALYLVGTVTLIVIWFWRRRR